MRIQLEKRDITRLSLDAIVNAANAELRGGGGVDGAIHRAAGPDLLRACKAIGGCPTGQAVITAGYRLPARHVIHTVGPVWQGGGKGEAKLLASCYRECLRIAHGQSFEAIAFPAISCGVYGYPIPEAVAIAVREVRTFLDAHDLPQRVVFCCFGEAIYKQYVAELSHVLH
jgi:O-acetyl-ADP-ribose deacetylase (regulator of RNase III)